MKKIYSFLLLSTLLLLGAQNAWGYNYLAGNWFGSDWTWSGSKIQFDNVSGTEYVSLYLAAETDYYFKILDGDSRHYGNSGTITESMSGWDFYHWNEGETPACKITTSSIEGIYRFQITWSDNHPVLQVIYPTVAASSYSVAFDNTASNWEHVYAYVFSSGGTIKLNEGWPGKEVESEGDVYVCDISSNYEPEYIIWSNGSSKTSDLVFTNEAVYNSSGIIANHAIGSTPVVDKYYSTFYAPYNVELPTKDDSDNDITVTAYTAEYDGENTLTLHSLTSVTNIIPGGQAVILQASTNGDYSLSPTAADAGTAGTNNLLGTASVLDVSSLEITSSEHLCVLGVNGSNVGFYNFTGASLAANKAYLIVPMRGSSAPAIHMVIEGENNATAIEDINANETAVKFIENGKLFIRKNGVVYDATGAVVR